MEHRHTELFETGLEDSRGREILKNEIGEIHKLVDGIPHTTTSEGEPHTPLIEFHYISIEEQLGYDPGRYPDNFDPVLWELEREPRTWSNGLSL